MNNTKQTGNDVRIDNENEEEYQYVLPLNGSSINSRRGTFQTENEELDTFPSHIRPVLRRTHRRKRYARQKVADEKEQSNGQHLIVSRSSMAHHRHSRKPYLWVLENSTNNPLILLQHTTPFNVPQATATISRKTGKKKLRTATYRPPGVIFQSTEDDWLPRMMVENIEMMRCEYLPPTNFTKAKVKIFNKYRTCRAQAVMPPIFNVPKKRLPIFGRIAGLISATLAFKSCENRRRELVPGSDSDDYIAIKGSVCDGSSRIWPPNTREMLHGPKLNSIHLVEHSEHETVSQRYHKNSIAESELSLIKPDVVVRRDPEGRLSDHLNAKLDDVPSPDESQEQTEIYCQIKKKKRTLIESVEGEKDAKSVAEFEYEFCPPLPPKRSPWYYDE